MSRFKLPMPDPNSIAGWCPAAITEAITFCRLPIGGISDYRIALP
jgi:hypothetical protein